MIQNHHQNNLKSKSREDLGDFGTYGDVLVVSWGVLGASWGVLGHLGPSWRHLRGVLMRLEASRRPPREEGLAALMQRWRFLGGSLASLPRS